MIVVVGHLVAEPGRRDEVVRRSVAAVVAARAAPGCLAFAVTADTVDPDRVCVCEVWSDRLALDAFRGSPGDDASSGIARFDVREFETMEGQP